MDLDCNCAFVVVDEDPNFSHLLPCIAHATALEAFVHERADLIQMLCHLDDRLAAFIAHDMAITQPTDAANTRAYVTVRALDQAHTVAAHDEPPDRCNIQIRQRRRRPRHQQQHL